MTRRLTIRSGLAAAMAAMVAVPSVAAGQAPPGNKGVGDYYGPYYSGNSNNPPTGSGSSISPCVEASALRGATVRNGNKPRIVFSRGATGSTVEARIYRVGSLTRPGGTKLVARYVNKTSAFTWNGKATVKNRKVTNGYYVVRLVMTDGAKKLVDTQTVALRRSRGRFARLSAFQGRAGCGAITTFTLGRPVFAGPRGKSLTISYRVLTPAEVTVQVLRGRKVVRTLRNAVTVRSAAVQRLRYKAPKRAKKGVYRIKLTVKRGGSSVTQTLYARKL